MQAGLNAVAWMGLEAAGAGWGGENLSGGETAKGIPRNWFTASFPPGTVVLFPTIVPISIVAVGAVSLSGRVAAFAARSRRTAVRALEKVAMMNSVDTTAQALRGPSRQCVVGNVATKPEQHFFRCRPCL